MYTPILTRCIVCPKCQTKTMRASVSPTLGKEYFDDKCRQYFGIDELVNHWGYDAGDFGNSVPLRLLPPYEGRIPDFTPVILEDLLQWWDQDTVSIIDEPEWEDLEQRLRDYEIVERMFLGIPEWSIEDYSVDTGATHV